MVKYSSVFIVKPVRIGADPVGSVGTGDGLGAEPTLKVDEACAEPPLASVAITMIVMLPLEFGVKYEQLKGGEVTVQYWTPLT